MGARGVPAVRSSEHGLAGSERQQARTLPELGLQSLALQRVLVGRRDVSDAAMYCGASSGETRVLPAPVIGRTGDLLGELVEGALQRDVGEQRARSRRAGGHAFLVDHSTS